MPMYPFAAACAMKTPDDTSAAVKHYHTEVGTAKVDALLAVTGSRHFLSVLGVVELHSAFARRVRTGRPRPAGGFLRPQAVDDMSLAGYSCSRSPSSSLTATQIVPMT